MGFFSKVKSFAGKALATGKKVVKKAPSYISKAKETLPIVRTRMHQFAPLVDLLPENARGPLKTILEHAETILDKADAGLDQAMLLMGNSDAQ